ncbi:MAG: DUF411 domain-containing protein [Kaiparowitsia implicata GSE-PSE-MK54-09C]|jgi:hypothetical protein|nr:DUF411 domain-containing protein [Kaiparowitsia implicata GSE-PSE-MK54-09C]
MNRRLFISQLLKIGLISTSGVLTACSFADHSERARQVAMNAELTVFRSPTCSCCGQWIEHIEAAGFQVQDNVTEEMTILKQQYGIPDDLTSCHTAMVGGYVIEGHVPAVDVLRLLAERPNVAGLAVPGMPVGSPGMESGSDVEPYTVFSFTQNGDISAFAEHA